MDVRFQGVKVDRDRGFRLRVPHLEIATGRVTALFGPNGSGKSTLLRLVAGLEDPTKGAVALDGRPATELGPASVAFAFQQSVFFSGTVRRNLALALDLRGVPADEAASRIDEVTSATGTTALLGADACRLSGGEGQRVNLARALALRSPLTLLDEPLAQLDGSIRVRLLDDLPDLLAQFAETTILVTHDLDEAARLADRLVVLIEGEVRADGDVVDVLRRPPDPQVAELLGFLVVASESGRLAVQPKRLRVGDGPVRLEMVVRRVVDLGHAREVIGTIADARVAVALPAGYDEPRAGASLCVAADEAIKF